MLPAPSGAALQAVLDSPEGVAAAEDVPDFATGGPISTALAGSPASVAEAMLDYYDIGVTTFLLCGYGPYADVGGYAEVIARVRDGAAERERRPGR